MAITYKAGNPDAQPSFLVEPGEYTVRVADAKQTVSKKGNDMIELKIKVIHPDRTEGPGLFDYLVFSEKALWKVDQFLAAVGMHPGEGEAFDVEPDDLIGKECTAELEQETNDKGNTSMKVARYFAADDEIPF